jgi:phosphoribosylanthranilate isomerase
MTKIKICGIQTVKHGLCAIEAGADYIGFVFAKSKRQVTESQAKSIIKGLRTHNKHAKMVGVFVDESLKEMERIARFCDLDILQLHGSELASDYEGAYFPIIKSVSIKNKGLSKEGPSKDELSQTILSHSASDYLLFDTWHKDMAGGSGQTFEWSTLNKEDKRQAFFLAGGLTIENVNEAIRVAKPYAIDVSSGVETEGVKDVDKIKAFIKVVKECDHEL